MASLKRALPDQGAFFAEAGWDEPSQALENRPATPVVDPRRLDAAALLEKLPRARSAECAADVDEAVRRRLMGTISALNNLCRRFMGFGLSRPVREQMIAVATMMAIGGPEAATALRRLLCVFR